MSIMVIGVSLNLQHMPLCLNDLSKLPIDFRYCEITSISLMLGSIQLQVLPTTVNSAQLFVNGCPLI